MDSRESTIKQILYYYVFQKKIDQFFRGEKIEKDKKIKKGYIINPEFIKEWKRRKNYVKIKKKYFENFNIEKTKLDKKQTKLIKDYFEKLDEKILNLNENNSSIIKYSDFMIINEKILTEQYLENLVNEKTFNEMKLNVKITFEEIKYIFKEEMIIFFF